MDLAILVQNCFGCFLSLDPVKCPLRMSMSSMTVEMFLRENPMWLDSNPVLHVSVCTIFYTLENLVNFFFNILAEYVNI